MTRSPNSRLRAIIHESGLRYEDLARLVRSVAAASGTTIRTGKSNVSCWLGGTPPNPQTARYLCEALSRTLGRPISLADIGLSATPGDTGRADVGLTVEGDPVEMLGQLGSADIERRTFLTGSAYSVAAAALPLGNAGEAHARTRRALNGGIAGSSEVRAVRDMVAMFTAIDERHGGQHGRSAVVQYLRTDVLGLCQAQFRTIEQRNDMLTSAASLAYLCGWKAYDAGEMGLAQRYYLQAYALTKDAGNTAHEAFTLRILAYHGMDNGRHEHVLGLADAALERAQGRVDRVTESLFVICRARALASVGQASRSLAEADRARTLAGSTGAEGMTGWASMWGAASANVASQTAKILDSIGDFRGAERHHANARRRYSGTEHQRIAALSAAAEGHSQYQQGQVERACATWGQALDTMTGIRSTRTLKAVHAMRSAVNQVKDRAVRPALDLDERAHTWLREAP
ncbi:hypothetical protein [Streptomyces sp. NPDC059256]|uniref:hypothetical protein n=1 Tax=Streptomyces sp. NPDC059256 TaxID=3346794 RepID=UPI0036A9B510